MRYTYILRPKAHGCCCVLVSEIERVRAAANGQSAWNIVSSGVLINPQLLESAETAVTVQDNRQVKRDYLRSVVAMYGKDKATLKRLGFLPA